MVKTVAAQEATAPVRDDRGPAFLSTTVLVATATTLMLEATRVFVSYLVFVVDQSERLTLAVTGFGVFGAIGLGGLLPRIAGWKAAIAIAASGLGLSRLVLQFWMEPEPRLILGAVAVICWGWLTIPLLTAARDAAALGLVLGLALDVAIRIAFRTVDLPWMPGLVAHLVAVALIGLLAVSAIGVAGLIQPTPLARAPVVSLLAVGPGLAVFHLMTGNLGLAQVLLDADFPVAAGLVALGMILGLGIVAVALLARSVPRVSSRLFPARLEGPLAILALALVALAVAALFRTGSLLAVVGLVAGSATGIVLLALALVKRQPGRRIGGNVTVWFTAGMLLQVALLFAFYTFTGAPLVIVVAWVLLLAGALIAGFSPILESPGRVSSVVGPVVAVVAALALAASWQALDWSEPDPGPPLDGEFTVMTYNLQNGFDIDEQFALDAQAETIAAAGPDIVILQEVSRGWLVSSGVDEALWLSQRLEMPLVFGASSGDGLWGNAILSRAPITESELHHFVTTQNLRRGVIVAQIATEGEPLWVFGTHLDNPAGAGEIRRAQVAELLDIWGGREPAIIAGDLNMDPDDEVLSTLLETGFVDPGSDLGEDAFTSEDRRRIDYVLATPGLDVLNVEILQRRTSDHLPVVARVDLR